MKQRCSLTVIVTTQYKGEEPTKEFKTLIGSDYADCFKQMDDFYANMAVDEQEDLIYLMVTPAQYCVEFGKRLRMPMVNVNFNPKNFVYS